MKRAALAMLALTGCGEPIKLVNDGYVMSSFSGEMTRSSIGFTVTFDNIHLPQAGNTCVGVEVCNDGAIE